MLASRDLGSLMMFCRALDSTPSTEIRRNDSCSSDDRVLVARGDDDVVVMCDFGVLLLDYAVSTGLALKPVRRAPGT